MTQTQKKNDKHPGHEKAGKAEFINYFSLCRKSIRNCARTIRIVMFSHISGKNLHSYPIMDTFALSHYLMFQTKSPQIQPPLGNFSYFLPNILSIFQNRNADGLVAPVTHSCRHQSKWTPVYLYVIVFYMFIKKSKNLALTPGNSP